MYVVLFLVGIAFLIYFLCVAFFVGHGTNFYFIGLILAVVVMTFAILLKRGFFISHFPLWIRRTFVILLCMGVMIFGIVEGFIISGFSMKVQPGADYVIVLGAQMKADGPSKALQYRLDEAIRYLNENPSSKVIVSGGQGSDEHISEAQGMYEYLVEKGIEKDRIIKEDKSVNTTQNLAFSAEYLDRERDSVAVVTNNFHVFRAVKIAEKAGYQNVCGIAAKGEPFLQINNMMREFFGVMKDFLFGNMRII